MRLVSLPHICMLEATPPELVTAAALAGFGAVGIRLQPTMAGERKHPMRAGSAMMRETLIRLKDNDLRVLDIESFWLCPETNVDDWKPEMEAAVELGAQSLQILPGDSDRSRLKDNFAAIVSLAKMYGLRAEFEYFMIGTVQSLPEALDVIGYAESENAGLLADVLHIMRCGTLVSDLAAVPSKYLHVFQLCDAPKGAPETPKEQMVEARFGRLLPGQGAADLRAIWNAIPSETHISVEVPLRAARHLPFEERAKIVRKGYVDFISLQDQ